METLRWCSCAHCRLLRAHRLHTWLALAPCFPVLGVVAHQHTVTSLLCKAVGVCRMMGPTLQGTLCPPIFVDASNTSRWKCSGGIAESGVQTLKKSVGGLGS